MVVDDDDDDVGAEPGRIEVLYSFPPPHHGWFLGADVASWPDFLVMLLLSFLLIYYSSRGTWMTEGWRCVRGMMGTGGGPRGSSTRCVVEVVCEGPTTYGHSFTSHLGLHGCCYPSKSRK